MISLRLQRVGEVSFRVILGLDQSTRWPARRSERSGTGIH